MFTKRRIFYVAISCAVCVFIACVSPTVYRYAQLKRLESESVFFYYSLTGWRSDIERQLDGISRSGGSWDKSSAILKTLLRASSAEVAKIDCNHTGGSSLFQRNGWPLSHVE
ncbi:MAG: hypothetical protein AAF226_13680, partial [Verrucomicrobiota bacterium]